MASASDCHTYHQVWPDFPKLIFPPWGDSASSWAAFFPFVLCSLPFAKRRMASICEEKRPLPRWSRPGVICCGSYNLVITCGHYTLDALTFFLASRCLVCSYTSFLHSTITHRICVCQYLNRFDALTSLDWYYIAVIYIIYIFCLCKRKHIYWQSIGSLNHILEIL